MAAPIEFFIFGQSYALVELTTAGQTQQEIAYQPVVAANIFDGRLGCTFDLGKQLIATFLMKGSERCRCLLILTFGITLLEITPGLGQSLSAALGSAQRGKSHREQQQQE
ncbi:hypothetical protein ACWAU3_22910 [Shewanella sp. JL219SE-S6]